MKISAAYIRVSTDAQTEYSPDSQLRLIRDYAKKNDLYLPDDFVFADEGISGRKAEKRPAFQKMMIEAKRKSFEVILIYNTSRFARNHEESVVYRSMLKRQGVEVISITQPNIDEKTDLLMNALYAVMDERYSLDLSENVKRGMIEKAMRGECVSSVPYGYKMSKETNAPIIVEEQAKIIKMIFNDYQNNKAAFAIARELNEQNIPAPRGGKWERARIDQILSNPFYCGYIRWNIKDKNKVLRDAEEWIIRKGNQPALISEEEHQKVLEIMDKNKRLPNKPNVRMAHWLSGLVRCSACGAGLNVVRSTTKGNPPYLRCRSYMTAKCTETQFVRASVLECYLFKSLEQIANNPQSAIFEKENISKNEDEKEKIIKLISTANKKMCRIKDAYEKGIDTIDEYSENKRKINSELASLLEHLKVLENKSAAQLCKEKERAFSASINRISSLLQSNDFDNETKYNAVRSIISKIIYSKKVNVFEVFYYIP